MTGRRSRRKGAQFERDVVNLAREKIPTERGDIYRGLQSQGGDRHCDVEIPEWWSECKVGVQPPIRKAFEQASRTAPLGRKPAAIIKEDRHDPFVVVGLVDWLETLGELFALRRQIAAAQTQNVPRKGELDN